MPILLVSFSIVTIMFASMCGVVRDDGPTDPVRTLAVGDPVAVIEELPDEVSNGTQMFLDGRNSTYDDGVIDHYEWKIYLNESLVGFSIDSNWSYMFKKLGLYKITLIVTTNDSKSDDAFDAVYSIPDSDADLMPDWWEIKYFGNMTQMGEQDFDGDGYTNRQEYASGTNPIAKDPGPSLTSILAKNWYYLAVIAVAIVAAVLVSYPKLKKRRKAEVKKQIEAAIEIEKALEEEDK